METLIKGATAGLAYGLLLGPMFFAGLRVTLERGLRHGLALIGGAFVSDAALALGGWWSTAQLASVVESETFQSVFGVASGLMLFGFGLSAVIPRKANSEARENAEAEVVLARRRVSFIQGLTINLINPSNWFFWLGMAAAASAEVLSSGEPGEPGYFMLAALGMLFGMDLLKLFIAHRIGKTLKPGWTRNITRMAGLVLMLVGLSVIIKIWRA